MHPKFKKILLGIFALSLMTIFIGGCGAKTSDSQTNSESNDEVAKGKIKLWVDPEYISAYQLIIKSFEKKYPQVKVTIQAGDAKNMKNNVAKDPSKAADVFMTFSDQIGRMAQSGLIYPLREKRVETVKKGNQEKIVKAVTWKNNVYGYPAAIDSQVLYYNKERLNSEDVRSWKGITNKAKLGVNLAETGASYTFTPLFVSNGDYFYGKNGDQLKGTNFNNQKGVMVLKWIAAQRNNHGVVQTHDDFLNDLQSDKIQAWIGETSQQEDIKKALGNKMAVASYPTIDLGQGEIPFKPFLKVILFGVNQQTKAPRAAMTLAKYLTTEDSQMKLFQTLGVVPANIVIQKNPLVIGDAVANAVITMSSEDHITLLPQLGHLKVFWPKMDQLINDTYNDKIPSKKYLSNLNQLVQDTSQRIVNQK